MLSFYFLIVIRRVIKIKYQIFYNSLLKKSQTEFFKYIFRKKKKIDYLKEKLKKKEIAQNLKNYISNTRLCFL